MKSKDVSKLIEKYRSETLSSEEIAFLDAWYIEYAKEKSSKIEEQDLEANLGTLWSSLSKDLSDHNFSFEKLTQKKTAYWPRIAAAACFLLVAGISLLYFNKTSHSSNASQAIYAADIKPGSNKAFLTLADGTKISLNDASNGQLVKQAGITITKAKNGEVIYSVSDQYAGKNSNTYNTIETPRSGQYQIHLPDGSKVWLNAATKLKFPVAFTKTNQRLVQLEGEAYFEIAHNAKQPFVVKTRSQEVEVLGTHFNISSYADDIKTKTTLLEGSVLVKSLLVSGKQLMLKPGQQSALSKTKFELKNIDTEQAVAWKNGQFMFDEAQLTDVMKEISRWYDVEIVYQGDFSNIALGGSVSKFINIKEVLDVLELTTSKIKFKIEGKTIILTRLSN